MNGVVTFATPFFFYLPIKCYWISFNRRKYQNLLNINKYSSRQIPKFLWKFESNSYAGTAAGWRMAWFRWTGGRTVARSIFWLTCTPTTPKACLRNGLKAHSSALASPPNSSPSNSPISTSPYSASSKLAYGIQSHWFHLHLVHGKLSRSWQSTLTIVLVIKDFKAFISLFDELIGICLL